MVCINATLHPEEAELVWAAVTRIAKERAAGEFSRVDALVEMADQVVRGTSPERSPTEIVVTIPIQVLDGTATDERSTGRRRAQQGRPPPPLPGITPHPA